MSTVDQDKMVMEVQKNATQRVRISHRWYKGRQYVDVRLVVVDMAGDFVPTRQGIMLRPELLAQVIQGLTLAAREVV
ncbi:MULTISPECIES: transcriptional coactivator p15/PC4 family protein [unclassified Caballeronia]|uniref:transcriptional coactivator p15/PC4 family protein n=1 Tax=unclassified Caballeronia TaxID=2646786 RepID=UPI002864CFD5|nr:MULTISPECIES: transcriptional coactivator p15/PC4 family protein [unclassified Caballeronia]MDR5770186.1 transcriptional coactivator p15/PC4 family protein [Caballeronia sp. LZ002]MDR5777734.1 transcriptional coactivator p15/PC4 family protein [Caballeronia sp. LZ002]MDR5800574.1 transcriptional coactivator p15/PC4 family protein [Caballeronia sp. LZ001]MDR5802515.1 transcriptional coactivator p15/PC4 family protein [Caballeronia sp. LZ001]MDR5803457.1 transcriptional coactivator p15/PC4 fa